MEMKVKIIDECDLKKNGEPRIKGGTQVLAETNWIHELYDEAKEKGCNIRKIPVAKSTVTGEIKIIAYELMDNN